MLYTSFSTVLPSDTNAYTIFHMSEEELVEIENRMRPGKCSSEGFISKEDRFKDVCIKDLTTLSNLGITCDQISHSLTGIIIKATKLLAEKSVFIDL